MAKKSKTCKCGWYLTSKPSDSVRELHDEFVRMNDGPQHLLRAIFMATTYVDPGETRGLEDLAERHHFGQEILDLLNDLDIDIRDLGDFGEAIDILRVLGVRSAA